MPTYKAALHNHTNSERRDPVKYSDYDLIDECAEKGFKILAITLHNKWSGSKELIDYAKSKGILLIPGIEKSLAFRHVLILNAKPESEKIRNYKHLREYKKKHPECFVIAAHPYYPPFLFFSDKTRKFIDAFDGIEFCWWYSNKVNMNKKAKRLAKEYKLAYIGTSDTHVIEWLGKTYCEIRAQKLTIEAVFKALRKGQFRNVSKPIPTWEMFTVMPFLVIRDQLWLLKQTLKKIKLFSKNK